MLHVTYNAPMSDGDAKLLECYIVLLLSLLTILSVHCVIVLLIYLSSILSISSYLYGSSITVEVIVPHTPARNS